MALAIVAGSCPLTAPRIASCGVSLCAVPRVPLPDGLPAALPGGSSGAISRFEMSGSASRSSAAPPRGTLPPSLYRTGFH